MCVADLAGSPCSFPLCCAWFFVVNLGREERDFKKVAAGSGGLGGREMISLHRTALVTRV